MIDSFSSLLIEDIKHQPAVLGGKLQAVRPLLAVQQAERVFFNEVIDGDAPLMLGLGRWPGPDAGVKIDSNEAVFLKSCHESRLDGKPAKALVTVMRGKMGGPGPAKVLQLQIKILDIEPDGAVGRKRENHRAGRFRARFKGNCKKRQHGVFRLGHNAMLLHAEDVLEMQAAAPPLGFRLQLPGKAVGHKGKLPGLGQVADVGKPHQGILHVGGDDLQIFRVFRRKSQHQSVSRKPLDIGAAGLQFFFQRFKAAVKMVDAVDHRFAFCHEAGDDQ